VIPGLGSGDQPNTFRRLRGHGWRLLGDDGAYCSIPIAMVRAWHMTRFRQALC
jgi:hypothetical protein